MKCALKSLKAALSVLPLALGILAWSYVAHAAKRVLHTYGSSSGVEITNLVVVSKSKLLPLLSAGYDIIPASAVGLGRADQGIVVIANFRSIGPLVDDHSSGRNNQVAIDIAILVAQPAKAAAAGLDIAGANHLYTLAIYSDDARYVASLRTADMPVELENEITYNYQINDSTGVGQLLVVLPDKHSPLKSFNLGINLAPATGALNAVFWYDGKKGTAALHFLDQPFQMGNASSQIYTLADSKWGSLLAGGGLGPCPPDPHTDYVCVKSPSLNLRYPQGTVGQLLLIGQP